MNLTDYVEERGARKRGKLQQFFRDRPELLEEAMAGRDKGVSIRTILNYLVSEHGYKGSEIGLLNLMDRERNRRVDRA